MASVTLFYCACLKQFQCVVFLSPPYFVNTPPPGSVVGSRCPSPRCRHLSAPRCDTLGLHSTQTKHSILNQFNYKECTKKQHKHTIKVEKYMLNLQWNAENEIITSVNKYIVKKE